MDLFFQSLAEWVGDLAERRYGRLAGCLGVFIVTAIFVAGVWLVWTLLT